MISSQREAIPQAPFSEAYVVKKHHVANLDTNRMPACILIAVSRITGTRGLVPTKT